MSPIYAGPIMLNTKPKLEDSIFLKIEKILRYTGERYFDTATNRFVAIGKHDDSLVMVPYEKSRTVLKPITIHAITRK